MRIGTAILFATALVALPVKAKVRPMSIDLLLSSADLVAVLDVTEVSGEPGAEVANAKVVEVVKGDKSTSQLTFRAHGNWSCDVSEAFVGQRVMLVLIRASNQPFQYEIAYSGRGAFTIEIHDAEQFAMTYHYGPGGITSSVGLTFVEFSEGSKRRGSRATRSRYGIRLSDVRERFPH